MGEIKPKYDFYENAAFLDDPINADLARKEEMERAGVVGPVGSNGMREVLAPPPPEE